LRPAHAIALSEPATTATTAMRNTHEPTPAHRPDSGLAGQEYLQNASAPRVNTDIVMMQALRRQYPELQVISVPAVSTSLLGYASSGHARLTPLPGDSPALEAPLTHRIWLSPARRNDISVGAIASQVLFGKFAYKWKHHEFIVYVAEGRDGMASYPIATFNYILGADAQAIDMLIAECSSWSVQLHNEIWVFDNGFWQKSADLWHGIQHSEWKT
jgi:transitional endoplasmic reticulum ATPase